MQQRSRYSLSNPVHFLALGFGAGLMKPAPGTWGTLVAVPIYWLLVNQYSLPLQSYLALTLVMFVAGVYICGKAAMDAGVHDDAAIVWDEIVGFFITMLAVTPSLINIILGFALFRLFDIAKPWPIGVVDRTVKGGLGIMIDDVIAGFAACLVLHLLQPLAALAG